MEYSGSYPESCDKMLDFFIKSSFKINYFNCTDNISSILVV